MHRFKIIIYWIDWLIFSICHLIISFHLIFENRYWPEAEQIEIEIPERIKRRIIIGDVYQIIIM